MRREAGGRSDLYSAKLRALVRAHWGDAARDAADGTFPGGATLRTGSAGWVLAEEQPERAIGGALAWARRWQVADLNVLAPESTGALARRAALFRASPRVWRIEGTALEPAAADPPRRVPPMSDLVARYVPLLRDAGAAPVYEDGILTGEVLGLEVCRVVEDDLGAYLEVGVGKHDREAQRLVHGDRPPLDVLAEAVAAVRRVRHAGATPHQLNQIARARWLRAALLARPELAGAARLSPSPLTPRRDDLRAAAPAAAEGEDIDGAPLLVVCSTGIDADFVPTAADLRVADPRRPRLVLAVPAADDHPLTRALAAGLVEPAGVVGVAPGWEEAAG